MRAYHLKILRTTYSSGYFSPAPVARNKAGGKLGLGGEKGDRFTTPAFSSLFDNPQNILKFRLHVSFLYAQNHLGKAVHAGVVLFFRCRL